MVRKHDQQILSLQPHMPSDSERKHKRKSDDNSEHKKHKKRRKDDYDDTRKSSKHRKDKQKGLTIVDDDPEDTEMWVESNIDVDGQYVRFSYASSFFSKFLLMVCNGKPLTTTIPTAASLDITSSTSPKDATPALPPAITTESKMQREEWMLLEPSSSTVPASTPPLKSLGRAADSLTEGYGDETMDSRKPSGEVDFFSGLGTVHREKKQKDDLESRKVCHTYPRYNTLKQLFLAQD